MTQRLRLPGPREPALDALAKARLPKRAARYLRSVLDRQP